MSETTECNFENADPIVSLVIPNYNEELILQECMTEVRRVLKEFGKPYEIIFVDDGSADSSPKILRGFAEQFSDVIFVQLKRNIGQQKAILTGLQVSRGAVVIPYDPDLQFAPECIPQLAEKIIAGYDLAGGIRTSRQDPPATRVMSWFGSFMINRALGRNVQDFGAVKAYGRRLAQEILSMPKDYLIVPAAGFALSQKTIEIPVQHQARKAGVSKWTFFMRLELCLDVYVSYAKRPFQWMMISGFLSVLSSALLAIGIFVYKFGVTSDFRGTIVFFDAFLFVMGFNFLGLSMIGEFIVRVFRRRFAVGGGQELDENMIEQIYSCRKLKGSAA